MTEPEIHVVGSVNLDLVASCESLPAPGETVLGNAFAEHPGGKGANQALAARRLGARVNLIARVGADSYAQRATALLARDGVNLDRCEVTPGVSTGAALIAVAADGENQIVVIPGANATLSTEDLPLSLSGALIGQLETPVSVLQAAASRCSGMVVINPAPAIPVPDELFKRADLIVVNQSEAAFYGLPSLLASGGMLAVTLGSEGAVLYDNGLEVARATPPQVSTIDATGAGDTFVAALTIALLEGHHAAAALNFACCAAALSTTAAGAQPALPWREAVTALCI